jgi:hypothetical protein
MIQLKPTPHVTPQARLIPLVLLLILNLSGCQKALQEMALPSSWQNKSLMRLEPPPLLDDLARWAQPSLGLSLILALSEDDLDARLQALEKASVTWPNQGVLWLCLSQAYSESGDFNAASVAADAAVKADPENTLTDLWQARMALACGDIPKARMLFYATKNFNRADTYSYALEIMLLNLMHSAGRFNPYSLSEAQGVFLALHLPQFEETLEVLREVFLDSLEQRPYDIQRRAPEAALRLIWTGSLLRQEALKGPRVLRDGNRERALGYALEAKGWEFLALHGEAFRRSELQQMALGQWAKIQRESERVMKAARANSFSGPGLAYLNSFQNWGEDTTLTLNQIIPAARLLPLWKMAARVPAMPLSSFAFEK